MTDIGCGNALVAFDGVINGTADGTPGADECDGGWNCCGVELPEAMDNRYVDQFVYGWCSLMVVVAGGADQREWQQ